MPRNSDPNADEQDSLTGPFGLFPSSDMLAYVLPMGVYLVLTSFEPAEPPPGGTPQPNSLGLTYDQYPAIYTFKLAVTGLTLWLCSASWRQWPLRVSPLAIGVGVGGVVLWIALCSLHLESQLMEWLGPDHWAAGLLGMLGMGIARPGYNPFEELADTPALCYAFLGVRFFGLAVMVPVFEELLLRGWLMRNVVSPNFWRVEFGRVTTQAVVVGTAFPMLYHPEKLASLVWFTLVTWLMVRTRNYWDCVVAHGVTNLLLGLYVITYDAWELW